LGFQVVRTLSVFCLAFFSSATQEENNSSKRWIVEQDPVKYPDSISPNFKSFLKGLLNKVCPEDLLNIL
jgi:hypothetical protein